MKIKRLLNKAISKYFSSPDKKIADADRQRILKQDGSTLTINMEWPKGKNPRTGVYTNRE